MENDTGIGVRNIVELVRETFGDDMCEQMVIQAEEPLFRRVKTKALVIQASNYINTNSMSEMIDMIVEAYGIDNEMDSDTYQELKRRIVSELIPPLV